MTTKRQQAEFSVAGAAAAVERPKIRWSKPVIEDVSVSEHTEIGATPGTDSSATLTTLS